MRFKVVETGDAVERKGRREMPGKSTFEIRAKHTPMSFEHLF